MFDSRSNRMLVALLVLLAVTAVMAPRAEGAADLKTEYLAPVNLPNGEAPGGQNMTLKVRVTNTSSSETSATVRLSINKYDHTCSGYPKNQPTLSADASKTYKELTLGPGSTIDVEFVDSSTTVPANTASVTTCYKTALQTGTGGYYSDSNSLNHTQSKVVKYVPGSGTTTTAPLAFTVTNLRTSPTSCGPGQHWVEATVNSTQIVRGSVSVEGISSTAIQNNVDFQSGNNTVRVTGTYPEAGDYRVKLTASATPQGGSTVSGNQQITATIPKCSGTLAVTAPASGESVAASSSYTVRWSSKNVPSDDRITIRVYDGATWHEVATGTPNDGSEQVTMPAGSATNAKVQMFSQRVSATAYSKDFTLGGGGGSSTISAITITQPAGGETATPGQTIYVRWTNSGNPGNQVKIRLFRGTAYYGELTQMITNDGNEAVALPSNVEMSDAKIEVISSTNVRGLSNAFTIGGGGDTGTTASISVTAPAANAQLNAGATTTVTWTSSGNTGSTVRLRLSLNGGAYADLETNVNNDGSEEVTLPAIFNYSANTGQIVGPSAAKIEVASTSTTVKGESGRFQIKVPALSFRTNLYDKIRTDCSACHPIATKSDGTAVTYQDSQNNDMINPQKARAQDDGASTVNETISPVIPFSDAISAAEMLRRFKSVKAVSSDYSRARGKTYVVASNPDNSGLHWKAQDSTSSIFEENMTIEGFVLKVQDWITLWIKQGAPD